LNGFDYCLFYFFQYFNTPHFEKDNFHIFDASAMEQPTRLESDKIERIASNQPQGYFLYSSEEDIDSD
jgi:hypothetical protein